MPTVKLNDVVLYYEIYGNGRPLLLICGLGSDCSSWSGVVKELSSYFQTIIFDNRGSGRSSIGYDICTISKMAEDTIALMDFLKIEKAHILGHSMGGYIALELAINYPSRVDKLILASTASVSSKRNNILFEKMYSQLVKEGPSEEWFKRWTFWLFSPETLNNSQFIETFIKNSVKYPYLQTAEGFKSQIDAIKLFDVRDKLGVIKAKTLILEGKDDALITPEESGILAKNLPGNTFRVLDGVAHSIHIENPRLFTEAMMGFLNFGN